jgi:flagellin
MPTVINTNLASLFAQNSLTSAQNNLAQSVQRLSSGLRINSAKDDAAGLAIAQLMQSNINGVNQSIRNMSDATNLLQTADTSLSTVADILLRMKQLSVQGYNGALSAPQKINLVTELKDLRDEINATAARTTFNNINLLGAAQGVDSATGDIYAGAFLTQTAVADNSGNILADTETQVGAKETALIQFNAAQNSGDTVTVNGRTFTATGSGVTAAQLATFFSGTAVVTSGTLTGTSNAAWTQASSVVSGDQLLFTASNYGNKTDSTFVYTSGTIDPTLVTNTTGTPDTTVSYDLNDDPNDPAYRMLPGTYTFASNGDQLTLSATIAGNYRTQTLTVGRADADVSNSLETNQTLNFDKFGIKLNISTDIPAGEDAAEGNIIASQINGKTIVIAGASAEITNIDVSEARSGTYTFTSSGTTLSVAYTDSVGNPSSETIDLNSVGTYKSTGPAYYFTQDNSFQIDFASMGIKLDVHAYQDMTVTQIATKIAALNNFGLGGSTGQLYVTQGSSDALKFQSGPNSDAFIQVNTLNIRTDSNSSDVAMQNLGGRINTLSGLAAANSNDTDAWQDAFTNLDSATEAAQIYISQERAVFGSQINRIGYLSTNLTAQSTNLQNSRSSIIDTDFASETAKLTRGQIMQQAATAMLAQANQMPNVVLSLLK